MTRIKQENTTKGFALLMTLIVLSAVIAITLSLVELSLNKIKLAVDTRDAEVTFHAASAALECGIYSRNKEPNKYIDWVSGLGSAPRINCMKVVNMSPYKLPEKKTIPSAGEVKKFTYQFATDVDGDGANDSCIYIETHIIDAKYADITESDISSLEPIECKNGSVCTVVVARAFNRSSCTAVPPPGQVEIMRELSAVF